MLCRPGCCTFTATFRPSFSVATCHRKQPISKQRSATDRYRRIASVPHVEQSSAGMDVYQQCTYVDLRQRRRRDRLPIELREELETQAIYCQKYTQKSQAICVVTSSGRAPSSRRKVPQTADQGLEGAWSKQPRIVMTYCGGRR